MYSLFYLYYLDRGGILQSLYKNWMKYKAPTKSPNIKTPITTNLIELKTEWVKG